MTHLTLISAAASPFARMNRIALTEKGLPFKVRNNAPWHGQAETPSYDPLEKLPILVFDNENEDPVYEVAQILEYIVQKYADKGPRLLTGDVDLDLKVRQIVVLARGMLDAYVHHFWEKQRQHKSEAWMLRQDRKIDGALRAFDEMARRAKSKGEEYVVGSQLTIADIAIVCAVGQVEFTHIRPKWQQKHPALAEYWQRLDEREAFKNTRPHMSELDENFV